jgi:hypothetical protein
MSSAEQTYDTVDGTNTRGIITQSGSTSFGSSIDVSFHGQYMFVGSPLAPAMYIYEWTGSIYTLRKTIPSTGQGYSIRCNWDGTRVVCGNPIDNRINIYTATGVVGDANGIWTTYTTATITGSSSFGHCVSIAKEHGNTIIVGEPASNKAYIYHKYAGVATWSLRQTLTVDGNNQRVYGVAINASAHSVTETNAINAGDMYELNVHQNYGEAVDMDSTGFFVAVGAPGTPIPAFTTTNCPTLPAGGVVGNTHIWSGRTEYTRADDDYLDGVASMGFFRVYETVSIDWVSLVITNPPANHGHCERNLNNFLQSGSRADPRHGNGLYPGARANTEAWDLCASGSCIRITPNGKRVIVGSPRYCGIGKQKSHCMGKIESYAYNSDNGQCTMDTENKVMGRASAFLGLRFDIDYTGQRLAAVYTESVNLGDPKRTGVHMYDWNGQHFYEVTPEIRNPGTTIGGSYGISSGTSTQMSSLNGGDATYGGTQAKSASASPSPLYPPDGIAVSSGQRIYKGESLARKVRIWDFKLTQTLQGNTLVGGYVAADNVYVGANDGASVNNASKKIFFGGTYGQDDNYYNKTVIENRSFYFSETDTDAHMQGYSELLLNKNTIAPTNGNTGDLGRDQVRVKAHEFHVDSYVLNDGRYDQNPILTTINTGQIKINPEFSVPNETGSCNANAQLDIDGDTLIRRRLNIGRNTYSHIVGGDKIPPRIFYDTRSQDIRQINRSEGIDGNFITTGGTATSYTAIGSGYHLVSKMLTNQHSFSVNSHRHKSRGECYGTVTYNAAECSLSLGSATSHVYNDYFEGASGTAAAFPDWVGNAQNSHGSESIKNGFVTYGNSGNPVDNLHFIVSLWVKPSSLSSTWQTLCGRVRQANASSPVNNRHVKLEINNTGLRFTNGSGFWTYSVSVPINEWSHIHGRIYTSSTSVTADLLYVNGQGYTYGSSGTTNNPTDQHWGGRFVVGWMTGGFTTGQLGMIAFEGSKWSGNNMQGYIDPTNNTRISGDNPTYTDYLNHGPPSQRIYIDGDVGISGDIYQNGVLFSGGGSGGLNSSGVLDISKDGEVAKFQPATSGEYTLVNFNSKVNSGSDKGFILVQDETANSPGTSGEDLRMTIGVHNDFRSSTSHSDELWFQGGGRLCYNVGSWDSELNTIIGTPGAGTGHGGVKHEWRINNSAKMTLDSSGDLDVLGDINFTGVLTQNGTTYGSGGGVTGFGSVTGNYGTVQTTGSSAGGYDGYSIHGRYVFMSAGTMAGGNHQCGIFNELDNNWIIFFYRNTYARLFYNGAGRLETTNNGITVTGSTYNTSDDRIKYNEEEVINCVNIINQLTPVKYEKLNQPEDIVGTWIPTDDEWESKKSNYGWYNEFGFIAQDVRKIPGLDILVKGEETEEIEIIKTELEYNKFSEEMRTKYTYRPDTKDYIHNDSGPTQVPLTINYTGFIPIITGAVKELSSALEQEKQKTENLQTRLTASEQAYQALLERVVALESA